jgi:hypothetical protein
VFRSFALKLCLFTVGVAAVVALANLLVPFFTSFSVFTWMSLGFFFIITLLTGYMGFRGLEKSAHGFVASVNGMVVLKLFLSAAFIVVYVVFTHPDGPAFVVSFFVLYVIFTVFEIRELVLAQKIKQQQQHGQR